MIAYLLFFLLFQMQHKTEIAETKLYRSIVLRRSTARSNLSLGYIGENLNKGCIDNIHFYATSY